MAAFLANVPDLTKTNTSYKYLWFSLSYEVQLWLDRSAEITRPILLKVSVYKHLIKGKNWRQYCNQRHVLKTATVQSRTQSPQAFWSAGGCQERLWGSGILLPQDFCGKTMQVVIKLLRNRQSKKKKKKFQFPRVSPGAHPLTKKPEDSGYEIGHSEMLLIFSCVLLFVNGGSMQTLLPLQISLLR